MPDKVTFLRLKPDTAVALNVPAKKARCVRSEDLFDGQDELVIEHNGRYYLLRKQRLGGLVLTGLDDIEL